MAFLYVSELQASAPLLRQPCLRVIANGNTPLTGVISAEVESTSHFSSDTFEVRAALSGLPTSMDFNYWSQSDRDKIQIDCGFIDANGNPSFLGAFSFIGVVDDVDVDMESQTLHLTGRDLSGDLIDTKIANINSDQSSSYIATAIAREHGMVANVAPTSIKNGKYFEMNHVRLSQEQSEWDLLIFLAQQEGFDLWVSGNTLNFQPPLPTTTDPYVLNWTGNAGNFVGMHLKRSQSIAKDVIVKVRSWNQAQGKTFNATAKVTNAYKSQRSNGLAQIYSFNVPNLDQNQANQYALNKAQEITKHERVITATLPGDNLLTNRSLIKLSGTKTTWDQNYYADTITRRMTNDQYTMAIRVKNHSTESTINT